MTNLKKPLAALQCAMSRVDLEVTGCDMVYAHVTTKDGRSAKVVFSSTCVFVNSSASVDLGTQMVPGKNWTKSRINSMIESIEYLAAQHLFGSLN